MTNEELVILIKDRIDTADNMLALWLWERDLLSGENDG